MLLAQPRPFVLRRPPSRKTVRPRADLQEGIALTGKFLGLFVLFSSSMNWWRYKRDREEAEKKNKK
jgi:hypothetical protein